MRTRDPRSLPHGSLGGRDIHFPTPQGGTPPPLFGSDATTPTSVCRSLHALKIWAIESREIPATFQRHGQFHKNGSTPRHSARKEPMPGARSPPHPIISAPPFSGEPWVRIPERPPARAVPRHQHPAPRTLLLDSGAECRRPPRPVGFSSSVPSAVFLQGNSRTYITAV